MRYFNWGTAGQLKDNAEYSITIPYTALLYIKSKFISISENKLFISAQKKDSWNDEAITFLVN